MNSAAASSPLALAAALGAADVQLWMSTASGRGPHLCRYLSFRASLVCLRRDEVRLDHTSSLGKSQPLRFWRLRRRKRADKPPRPRQLAAARARGRLGLQPLAISGYPLDHPHHWRFWLATVGSPEPNQYACASRENVVL